MNNEKNEFIIKARELLQRNNEAEATKLYLKVLATDNDCFEAWHNLGLIAKKNNDYSEALFCYKKALTIDGNVPEANLNYARLLLQKGDYFEGFKYYRYDFRLYDDDLAKKFSQKEYWLGDYFSCKTLLLVSCGGMEEVLLLLRYLPMVKRRGGIVVLAVQREFVSLLNGIDDLDGVVDLGKEDLLKTEFDCYTTLSALPHLFGTTLRTIPYEGEYISLSKSLVKKWRQYFKGFKGMKVGIACFDGVIELDEKLEFLKVPGVSFFAIQRKVTALAPNLNLVDLTANLANMSEVAAVMKNLDLVITVDSVLAHLAGIIGRPVWILLTGASKWWWLEERQDSPWYPSALLFRQDKQGEWSGVLSTIKDMLMESNASENLK